MREGRNFILYLFSSVLSALTSLLLMPVLTHELDPADYGKMVTALTLISIFCPVVAWGIIAFNRVVYVREPFDRVPGFIGAALVNAAGATIITAIAFLAFSRQLSSLLELPESLVSIISLIAATTIMPQLLESTLTIRRQAVAFSLFESSNALMNLALTLVLVLVFTRGWSGRIEAMVGANLILTIVAVTVLLRIGVLKASVAFDGLAQSFRFGAGVVPSDLGSLAMRFSDRLMVVAFAGTVAAGHYAVAAQLSTIMIFILVAVHRVWTPYLFHALKTGGQAERLQIVRRSYLVMALFIFCFVVFNLLMPFVYKLMIAPEYHASLKFVFWLTLGHLFTGIALTFNDYIHYHRKTHLLAATTLISVVAYFILARVLVESLGANGVAIAFAVTSGIVACVSFGLGYKLNPMPWTAALRRNAKEV